MLLYVVIEIIGALFFSGDSSSELQQATVLSEALTNPQALPQDLQPLIEQTTTLLWQATLFSGVAYIVLGALYFALMESSNWQATLGKRLIGIKVTDAQGQRIGLGRALARFFAASLSWVTMNLGHALAAWTPERRALHDYVAGTRVENVDPAQAKMPLWGWLIVAMHAFIFLLSIIAIFAVVFLAMQKLAEGM